MDVANNIKFGGSSGRNEIVKRLLLFNKSTKKTINYLNFNIKVIFIQFEKVFTKAPILGYFDPKCHV